MWKSDGIDYYWAVNNAFLTASNLAAVVNSVPGEKVVMAHSLGNMVVSSAFADHGMNAGKYFALNAAVASEAFDSTLFNTSTNNPLVHTDWHEYLPRTWSACWNELFTSTDDRSKLTWRGRFATVAPKVYNYWSSGDEVIEIGGPSLSLLSNVYIENFRPQARQNTWHKQELFKGRNVFYGSGWCGWGFESNVVASVANAAPTNFQSTPAARRFSKCLRRSAAGVYNALVAPRSIHIFHQTGKMAAPACCRRNDAWAFS